MRKIMLLLVVVVVAMIISGCELAGEDPNVTDDFVINLTNGVPVDEEEVMSELPVDESRAVYRVTVTEGELARIPVDAYDPDGRDVELTFGEPFNEEGLWLTEIGDEGRYLVRVTASDGLVRVSEYVLVVVERANRPPVVECPETIRVSEGEMVNIRCNIFDEDGEPVVVSYDGWMRTSSYRTDFGDAGNHSVLVRASDGVNQVTRTVNVVVDRTNRPPVIEPINDSEVLETETFSVTPEVFDPDGDPVTVSFSPPLDENGSWTPDFGDRGTYTITVTASDGIDSVRESFRLEVLPMNRPPVLKPIDPITVYEGETVRIPVEAFDPDGDDVIVSFSGWMDSDTYETTFDDAYPDGCDEPGCTATYFVNVTVSDGVLETSQEVEVRVRDQNRPPVFIWGGE